MKARIAIRIVLCLGLAEAFAFGAGSVMLSTPAAAQFWGGTVLPPASPTRDSGAAVQPLRRVLPAAANVPASRRSAPAACG
jgi:hypothetical protein